MLLVSSVRRPAFELLPCCRLFMTITIKTGIRPGTRWHFDDRCSDGHHHALCFRRSGCAAVAILDGHTCQWPGCQPSDDSAEKSSPAGFIGVFFITTSVLRNGIWTKSGIPKLEYLEPHGTGRNLRQATPHAHKQRSLPVPR